MKVNENFQLCFSSVFRCKDTTFFRKSQYLFASSSYRDGCVEDNLDSCFRLSFLLNRGQHCPSIVVRKPVISFQRLGQEGMVNQFFC